LSVLACSKRRPSAVDEALAAGGTRRIVQSVAAARSVQSVSPGSCYLLHSNDVFAALEFTGKFERRSSNGQKEAGLTYACAYQIDGSGNLLGAPQTSGEVYERDPLEMALGSAPDAALTGGGSLEVHCGPIAVMWSTPDYLYFKDYEGNQSVEIATVHGRCSDHASPFAPGLIWQRGP